MVIMENKTMTETVITDEENYQTYEEFIAKIKYKRPLPVAIRINTYEGERSVTIADRRRMIKKGLIELDYRFPFLSVKKLIPGLRRISPPDWKINLIFIFRRMCLDKGDYRSMCILQGKYTTNYDLRHSRKFIQAEHEFTSWKDISDYVSAYGTEYLKRMGLKSEDIKEN